MKYAQFIKSLKEKGVIVKDRSRHLFLSYGSKTTSCKRHPSEEYSPILLKKILKELGVPNP